MNEEERCNGVVYDLEARDGRDPSRLIPLSPGAFSVLAFEPGSEVTPYGPSESPSKTSSPSSSEDLASVYLGCRGDSEDSLLEEGDAGLLEPPEERLDARRAVNSDIADRRRAGGRGGEMGDLDSRVGIEPDPDPDPEPEPEPEPDPNVETSPDAEPRADAEAESAVTPVPTLPRPLPLPDPDAAPESAELPEVVRLGINGRADGLEVDPGRRLARRVGLAAIFDAPTWIPTVVP
jgi:hypothetical protein